MPSRAAKPCNNRPCHLAGHSPRALPRTTQTRSVPAALELSSSGEDSRCAWLTFAHLYSSQFISPERPSLSVQADWYCESEKAGRSRRLISTATRVADAEKANIDRPLSGERSGALPTRRSRTSHFNAGMH